MHSRVSSDKECLSILDGGRYNNTVVDLGFVEGGFCCILVCKARAKF